MSRSSPASKRPPGAAGSHRNAQHENGLVGSGRRLAKQQKTTLAAAPTRDPARPARSCGPALPKPLPSVSSASSVLYPLHPSAVGRDNLSNVGNMATAQDMCQAVEPIGSGGARRLNNDRRPSLGNVSSTSSTDSFSVGPTSATTPFMASATPFDESHRRIDVNAAKNANVHRDTGPVSLALTVLRSCPLYDTIAILIILMQLSPVALSSIYMLFTVLTFVPPVTTNSGLSMTEIFEGTLGTPALATVACMDVGFLLVWLFLWAPLQQLILDFAQIVIALTLGGGGDSGGSRQSSANNIFVCLGIVFFSHFGHVPSLQKLTRLGPLFSTGHTSTSVDGPVSFQPAVKLFTRRGGGVSWLRNIFAIHILTQGIVRYVREWYLRREKRDSMAHSMADPEAGKGILPTDVTADTVFSVADIPPGSTVAGSSNGSNSSSGGYGNGSSGNASANGDGVSVNANANTSINANASNQNIAASFMSSTGTDATGPGGSSMNSISNPAAPVSAGLTGPTPSMTAVGAAANTGNAGNAGNASMTTSTSSGFAYGSSGLPSAAGPLSAKKKRKQSALVRLRQPLWAALASTKIVMIKEYELSQAASESAGAEATDVDNLGNAPFYTQPCQIWICYVGHDEVCFSTSVFPDAKAEPCYPPNSSYVDTTKPFFVRINNATWQPTRIMAIPESDEDDVPSRTGKPANGRYVAGTRWNGDIYGLTPLSSYECEFVSTLTGAVLFSTSVRTAPAPSRSADVAAVKPAPPSQLRPHESPATTIKASIAAQEAKLYEEKARLKALRKENNRRINALKKEIDRLTASAQSAGGNDEKLKQKITQNTVQQKQAEQAIEALEAELREVSVVPEELLSRHRNKKSEWDRERALFDGAVASLKSFKSAVDSELRTLEEEQGSLQAKKNKIASRIAKADSDHSRIMDANAQGLDEVERRNQERASIESDILQASRNYSERIAAIQASNEEKVHTINTMHETMRSFYSSFDSERPYEDRGLPASGAAVSGAPGAPLGTWPSHQAPPNSLYSLGSLWPMPGMPASGQSPVPSTITPVPTYTQAPPLHTGSFTQLPKMRGRSSSMLSDVSGFTQSSAAEEDAMVSTSAGIPYAGTLGTASPAASMQTSVTATLRSPPGLGLGAIRRDSGSGSTSSVRSGSGSAGSGRDPASPL